jgi:hypothetical protein
MSDDNEYDRLEGLVEIRKFIDPLMSERTFFYRHRQKLTPYLFERREWWRMRRNGKRPAQFFSFKKLILIYMVKNRIL